MSDCKIYESKLSKIFYQHKTKISIGMNRCFLIDKKMAHNRCFQIQEGI